MIKVLIDPGHGKTCPNSSPDKRIYEWKYARELASIIEGRLDTLRIPHQRTTEGDIDTPLKDRCKFANVENKKNSCILISLHLNASGNTSEWRSPHGWSIFTYTKASSNSIRLASCIEACVENTKKVHIRKPSPNQPYWKQNLAMCRDTSCPAVLIENMFQDNKEDVEFLLSEEGKGILSEAIVEGICNYIGIEYERNS